MKLKLRFLLAGILITAWCSCVWAKNLWGVYPLSLLLPFVILFLTPRSSHWKRPLSWAKDGVGIVGGLGILVALIICSLLWKKPLDRRFPGGVGEWYFIGPMWLLLISLLVLAYVKEKRRQKAAAGDSSSTR